ncbi:unnamed protein product [Peniophora sp. CBMAI 1063]|nr:unnamed protein product [Peniophora sp. CBMAI 1063]
MSPVNPATLVNTAIDALHVPPAHQVQTVQSQPSPVADARLHATNPRAPALGDGLHSRFGHAVYKLIPRAVPEASHSAAFAALGILVGILALASAAGLAFFLRRRYHRRALNRRRRAHRVTIDPIPSPTPFMRKAPPHPLNLSDRINIDVPISPTTTSSSTNFKLPFHSSQPSTPGSGGLARFLHGVHGSISSIGFGPSRDDEERVIDISRAVTPVSARLPLMDFTTPSPRSAAFTLSRASSTASATTFGNVSPVDVRVPLDLLDASPPRSAFIDMSAEERDLTMMSPLSPEAPRSAASTGTFISSVTPDRSPRTPYSAVSSKFQLGYDGTGTFGSGTMMSTKSGKSTTTTSTSTTTYTSPTPYVPPRPPLHTAASFDSSLSVSSTKSSTSPPKRPRRRDTKDFLRARDESDALLYAALKREARKNKKGKETRAESSDGENANPFLDPADRGRSLPPAYSPPHADSPLRAMFSPTELSQARADMKLAPSLSASSSLRSTSTSSTSTRLPTRSSSLMIPGSSRGAPLPTPGNRGLVSHPSINSLASSTYSHTRSDSGRSTRSTGRPLPLPPGSF